MDAIRVHGLRPLNGSLRLQGSKNAALPVMAAALLCEGTVTLHQVPDIADVGFMADILRKLGCLVERNGNSMTIDAGTVSDVRIPEDYVGKMRSSCLLLGPLLSRTGEAVTSYPGGCVIGKRPIDYHIQALTRLGAEFEETHGVIHARARKLFGSWILLPYPSVGATENALLAAVCAEGTTVLLNCAMEPEIEELCRFLLSMGARIQGIGGPELVVEGVSSLSSCEFRLCADRICAGTYLAAAVVSQGDVTVFGLEAKSLEKPLELFSQMGAEIREGEKELSLVMKKRPSAFTAKTGPYPAFPTDLQPIFLAAAATARGESRIRETVFEARFEAAKAMRAFGAEISCHGDEVWTTGRYPLHAAAVKAPDLRGGAALILAALAAEGESVVEDEGHMKRGYENICRDLRALGAEIEA